MSREKINELESEKRKGFHFFFRILSQDFNRELDKKV